jgi:hypothetical protein
MKRGCEYTKDEIEKIFKAWIEYEKIFGTV